MNCFLFTGFRDVAQRGDRRCLVTESARLCQSGGKTTKKKRAGQNTFHVFPPRVPIWGVGVLHRPAKRTQQLADSPALPAPAAVSSARVAEWATSDVAKQRPQDMPTPPFAYILGAAQCGVASARVDSVDLASNTRFLR